jgi:hypothetical protein
LNDSNRKLVALGVQNEVITRKKKDFAGNHQLINKSIIKDNNNSLGHMLNEKTNDNEQVLVDQS